MRRMNHPSIANIIGFQQLKPNMRRASFFEEFSSVVVITPEMLSETLESGSLQRISDFCSQLITISKMPSAANSLAKLTNDPSIAASFVGCFSSGINDAVTQLLMDAISAIFPSCNDELQRNFIDEGLLLNVSMLLSSEVESVIYSALNLIAIVSLACAYARDSVLTFGLLDDMIRMCQTSENKALVDEIAETIEKIFTNEEEINSDTLISYLEPIGTLLKSNSEKTVNSILMAFHLMLEKSPSLVMNISCVGIYHSIMNYLANPAFQGAAIKIVSDLCLGNPSDVKLMIENGLVSVLLQFLNTEYVADILWDLSNLVELMPQYVIPMLTDQIISTILEITMVSSYVVKREGAIFLSTLIQHSDSTHVPAFVNQDIIEVLVEMLGSSIDVVIIRCISAIMKLSNHLESDKLNEFVQYLLDADIIQRLNDLSDHSNTVIKNFACIMLNMLNNYA